MAHPNIDERRKFVKELFEGGKSRPYIIQVASVKFNCSTSAIDFDIRILTDKHGTPLTQMGFRKSIYKRDGRICQYCGSEKQNMLVEHIVPVSKGGQYINENMVVACYDCNNTKRSNIWVPVNFMKITERNIPFRLYVLLNAVKDFR